LGQLLGTEPKGDEARGVEEKGASCRFEGLPGGSRPGLEDEEDRGAVAGRFQPTIAGGEVLPSDRTPTGMDPTHVVAAQKAEVIAADFYRTA
jgi:hypothetical protein